jgi:glycosyltransferase involved in cell wall biosynthesis
VAKEDILLCHFGFLNQTKGVEALVKALHWLVEAGYPVKLLMVGGETGSSDPTNLECARKIKALIEDLGLEERVKWTGYTSPEEVSANLMASDICVLPYRDGVSLRRGSLHAALIHGLPVISTYPRVPIKELEDGENIKLIPPDSPESIAQAVIELSNRPELRQRLGDGARKLSALFGWEGIAEETLKLYRELA